MTTPEFGANFPCLTEWCQRPTFAGLMSCRECFRAYALVLPNRQSVLEAFRLTEEELNEHAEGALAYMEAMAISKSIESDALVASGKVFNEYPAFAELLRSKWETP